MQRVRKALRNRRHLGPVEKGLLHRGRHVHRLRRVRGDLPRRRNHEQSRRDYTRAQARRAPGRRRPSRQLQRMRRVRRRLPVRLHLAVAGKHGGLPRQGAGQRKDLRRMPALRRGLRMGRNLHHAVRPEGGVPEFARVRAPRGRRSLVSTRTLLFSVSTRILLFSVSTRIVLAIALVLATIQPSLAAELSPGPESDASAACNEIKTALHALAESEHAESLALDLASGGGNSTAIVMARLSVLLDRTQDLRVT